MRIYSYETIDKIKIQELFLQFDDSIIVDFATPINTGMSTSNYKIKTNKNTYLLKIYPESNDHSDLEIAMYKHAREYFAVPKVLYCDSTKDIFDKTYVILEYIESQNFKEFLISQGGEFGSTVYKIGAALALLHTNKYEKPGVLDKNLVIKKIINPISLQCKELLEQKAGEYLCSDCKENLLNFIIEYPSVMEKLKAVTVLTHGDFNFSNILIDKNEEPWIIDFEYAFSNSMYYDIGKFFRGKEPVIQSFIDHEFINQFYEGLDNSVAITN